MACTVPICIRYIIHSKFCAFDFKVNSRSIRHKTSVINFEAKWIDEFLIRLSAELIIINSNRLIVRFMHLTRFFSTAPFSKPIHKEAGVIDDEISIRY